MKILVAMSGGVDSAVAACLLQKEGHDCSGAIMELCTPGLLGAEMPDSAADAQAVAHRLGIPFYRFDCTDRFRRDVVESFIRTYEEGGTPNPCIECNRHLKFGAFLEKAIDAGFDAVATGHYATVRKDPVTGRYLLCRAADRAKDQTYFLYTLDQRQLSKILFPLGGLTKAEAREIAGKYGLINARKRDSQDICFIPDGDYLKFMERYTGKTYPAGDFLDRNGKVIGRHHGAVGYTVGQRKGLGLAMGAPVYVCAKDMAANTVTVDGNDALMHRYLYAGGWNWIAIPGLTAPMRVTAKVRYRHTEQPATVYPEEKGTVRVEFDQPQRAITAGQAVVLYDGDTVVGGGTITGVA